jgi:hypothetical protein
MQERAALQSGLRSQTGGKIEATGDWAHWADQWVEESELPARITYIPGDSVLDVVAPKGLTLWYKQPFRGNPTFHFQVRALSGTEPTDRCSDLNCFWMASDPEHPDSLFARKSFRAGRFGNYYSLRLYYVGFGGNNNTTTRFRRYDGNLEAFKQAGQRPDIQKEYTDPAHLIRPDHWYDVRIVVRDGRVQYWSDNECLFDYVDPKPLRQGWFGFRTTQNHLQIRRFHVTGSL